MLTNLENSFTLHSVGVLSFRIFDANFFVSVFDLSIIFTGATQPIKITQRELQNSLHFNITTATT